MKFGEFLTDVETADSALDNGIFLSDDVQHLKDFLGERERSLKALASEIFILYCQHPIYGTFHCDSDSSSLFFRFIRIDQQIHLHPLRGDLIR